MDPVFAFQSSIAHSSPPCALLTVGNGRKDYTSDSMDAAAATRDAGGPGTRSGRDTLTVSVLIEQFWRVGIEVGISQFSKTEIGPDLGVFRLRLVSHKTDVCSKGRKRFSDDRRDVQ